MNINYTSESNIRILISLLKKHNIKKIIVNPGTTNISFVASVQNDSFFEIFSCVDERSASYMACGMAAESGEPVVITCTGATASRNYAPGLTEAFYRKLPVIAITATQHLGRVGQNVAQVLDRSMQFKDLVKKSVTIPIIGSDEDKWACNNWINDALLECRRNGGGPVHINLVTTYSNDMDSKPLGDERKISRYFYYDNLPKIESEKVAIFIGNHTKFPPKLIQLIENFCEKYNGVVLCDHTSNYNGKYKIMANIICSQETRNYLNNIDLLIDIGNISGAYINFSPLEVWRVNPDGEIRDTYKKMTNVFEMEEATFFEKYNNIRSEKHETTYYNEWIKEYNRLFEKMQYLELPFSNLWIAGKMINRIKENEIVHLAILNTLRSWNYYKNDQFFNCYCNTGGFGIDGIVSTALGASLCTDSLVYCFVGDLAFFYDLNAIGNRDLKSNLRIMLINNGCGTEFHNYNNRGPILRDKYDISLKYIAADGHFGNKSKELVKNYSQNLGFEYLSAGNKKEFLESLDKFTSTSSTKPIIFEVFVESEDESNALKMVNSLDISNLEKGKNIIKKIIGKQGVKTIKRIIKKV